jgi:hypothetical protein
MGNRLHINFGTATLLGSLLRCRGQSGRIRPVKCWQAIAAKLSKARFSWGCSSEIDSTGRVLDTADAYSREVGGFCPGGGKTHRILERRVAIDRQLELT